MPKGTVTCNNILGLYYNATAIANIADNAASSPITNIKVRLATASYTAASTGSANEATYTNYAAQDVARSMWRMGCTFCGCNQQRGGNRVSSMWGIWKHDHLGGNHQGRRRF